MPAISDAQYRILDHLIGGGELLAHRTYPMPHQYHLVKKIGEIIEGRTREVNPGTIAGLLTKGYIAVRPIDETTWDRYAYRVTPVGESAYAAATQTQKKKAQSGKGAE